MKIFKYTFPLFFGLLLMSVSLSAQGQTQIAKPDSITNQELQKFAEISNEAKKIQMEAAKKVDSMLSQEEMSMRRFREIIVSKRNPKMADSLKVTPEEEKTIQKLQPKLMKMQQESQQKFVAIIQDKGMTPQRFQQIMQAIRTDPGVMKRFQNTMIDSVQS